MLGKELLIALHLIMNGVIGRHIGQELLLLKANFGEKVAALQL